MEKKQIVKELVSLIKGCQTQAGDTEAIITASTIPIGGLKGFDSLTGVDVTMDIEIHFSLPNDPKRQSFFVETDEKKIPRTLSIDEIAQKIQEEMSRTK